MASRRPTRPPGQSAGRPRAIVYIVAKLAPHWAITVADEVALCFLPYLAALTRRNPCRRRRAP
jgi:hypothetical protein